MKKVLFILFMLISSLAWSQGFVERHLLSTEITETENSFVYRHYYIPVLDITYHEFSADSITWRKDYHVGDCYVRFNNYVSNQTDDAPVYHPEDKWWVFNFCTCNGAIDTTGGGGTVDSIFIIAGGDTITFNDFITIPFPDSITATTTNYMDSLTHTHAWEAWINDMEDVDAYPNNGQVMKWNAARGQWVEADDLFGIGLLDSTMLDTTVLVIDGGLDYQIINDTTIVYLGLPDTITASTINEVSANSHTHEWEAWLNDLNDVDAYPTDGQVLTWDTTVNQWIADDVFGGTGGLVVTEEDGFPYVTGVNQIRFSNTHVTDRGAGVVSVFIGDGADSLTYISAFNDVYRTGKVWVPAGDNRITFSSPLPDSSYVVAGLYTIYGNQVRQNLNYELKDTAGFTALGVMDDSWLHYLAIMPDDSLGFDLDLSSVDWWKYFDISGDSIFVDGVLTDNTLRGTGSPVDTLGVDTTVIATKYDLTQVTGSDNWGTQYVVNNADSLLKGRGTVASPLTIDTALVATQYDLTLVGGGANPAGTGSEIQFRSDATTFGAVTGSSVSTNSITLTGTATASNFILSSDFRLKENIYPATDLSWTDKLNFVTYTMKGNSSKRYGLIAQEVLQLNPEMVHKDFKGYYSISMIDILTAKIARQDEIIKDLVERIERLENAK